MKNWLTIIREQDGVAVVEYQGEFFCVGVNRSFVFPPNSIAKLSGKGFTALERARRRRPGMYEGGATVCSFTPNGLKICATPRTRKSAMAMFRREVKRSKEGAMR